MTGTEPHTGEALAQLIVDAVLSLLRDTDATVVAKIIAIVTDGASAQVCGLSFARVCGGTVYA